MLNRFLKNNLIRFEMSGRDVQILENMFGLCVLIHLKKIGTDWWEVLYFSVVIILY